MIKRFFKRLLIFFSFIIYGIIGLSTGLVIAESNISIPFTSHGSIITGYIVNNVCQYLVCVIILAIITIITLWISRKMMKNKAKIKAPKTLWLNRINAGLVILDIPFSIIDMALGEDNIPNYTFDTILSSINGILLLLTLITGIINLVHGLKAMNFHWFKTELIFENFAILMLINPMIFPLLIFMFGACTN